MARNSKSRREWNIEGGVGAPPVENESVMLNIRTFLMDRGRVWKFVIRALLVLLCVWGFILLLFKGVENVAPDAFLRQETQIFFWWFGINLMGSILVVMYLIHMLLPKRD